MYAHNSKYQRENPEVRAFLRFHDLNDVVGLLYSRQLEGANARLDKECWQDGKN